MSTPLRPTLHWIATMLVIVVALDGLDLLAEHRWYSRLGPIAAVLLALAIATFVGRRDHANPETGWWLFKLSVWLTPFLLIPQQINTETRAGEPLAGALALSHTWPAAIVVAIALGGCLIVKLDALCQSLGV